MRDRVLWIASLAVAAGLGATAVSLDALGRSRRVAGPGHALVDGGVPVVAVETADEAFRVWRSRGVRGRVVVSLSSRLYFVPPGRAEPEKGPGGTPVNPADALERALDARNFLLAAVERGIAREVRHVLPDAVLRAKAAAARAEEGVRVRGDTVDAPYFGSPRSMTSLDGFRAPADPALLFVSASAFSGRSAEEVLAGLSASGLRADLVILCASRDDADVSDGERAELARFAALLGAS